MFFATSPIVRRARSQWPLLLTLAWALVTTATLAAMCAILMGPGMARGLAEHVHEAGPDTQVTTTVLLTPEAASAGADSIAQALSIAADAVAPVPMESSVWASSPLFYLPGVDPRVTYALDGDTVQEHSVLSAGRWPERMASPGGDFEVVLLESTATALGVALGDELVLTSHATADRDAGPGARVATVVGLAHWKPESAGTWSRDRLNGAGVGTALTLLPAYGPLLIAPGSLMDTGQPVERASIEIAPQLFADPSAAFAVADRLGGIKPLIQDQLGEAVAAMSVQSKLGATMVDARAQQVSVAAMVAALLVAVVLVAAAAMGHVGAALAGRRTHEWSLAVERGASRWQVVRSTLTEVGVLAAAGAGLGVLAAPIAYRAAAALIPSRWPNVDGVGAPQVTWWAVAAAVAGAVVPAVAIGRAVWRGVRATAGQLQARREASLWRRVGLTVGAVVLAAVGYVQLRSRPSGQLELDWLLVVSPALGLIAAALAATWMVPLITWGVERVVSHSRGLVAWMGTWRAARTAGAHTALPTVLAAAALVFTIQLGATWLQSQEHQSELAVGVDLSVPDVGQFGSGQAVEQATGVAPSPVLERPIQLGARPGAAAMIAMDTNRAGDLMRGRAPAASSWHEVSAPLRTSDTTDRIGLASADFGLTFDDLAAPALIIGGAVDSLSEVALEVTPTAVLADNWGKSTAVTGEPVVLDGNEHRSALDGGLFAHEGADVRLVAVALSFDLYAVGEGPPAVDASNTATVTIAVPGGGPGPARDEAAIAQEGTGDGAQWHVTEVTNTANANAPSQASVEVPYVDGALHATVGATTFATTGTRAIVLAAPVVDEVPVLVSESFSSSYGAGEGDVIDVRMASASVPAAVVGVVPYVPSQPGAQVILADHEVLTWALLGRGELDHTVDAWWVDAPSDHSVSALAAVGMFGAVTVEHAVTQARSGHWSTPVMGALALLLGAAAGLAWAAAGARASGLARGLGRTNARLRGLGARRRDVRAIGTLSVAIVGTAQVAVGAVAGALVTWAVAPWVVAGDAGRRPVPSVIIDWSPATTASGLAILLVVLVMVTLPAARAGAVASVPVALRQGDAA